MSDETDTDPVEAIEAKRAARKDGLEKQAREQLAIDLAALDAAEVEHGDSKVARVTVLYSPGLPAMAICRTPSKPEIKRFRDRTTPKRDGDRPDLIKPFEELASATLIYPPPDVFSAMCDERPALAVALGSVAVKLATAQEAAEGKA